VKRLHVFVALVAALYLGFLPKAWPQAGPDLAQLVARLPYGQGRAEVGIGWGDGEGPPESITTLAVDDVGRFYLADSVNQAIKRFSHSGAFELATQGRIGLMGPTLAVDDHDFIYAADEEEALIRFDGATGKPLWTVTFGGKRLTKHPDAREVLSPEARADIERTWAISIVASTPISELQRASDGRVLCGLSYRVPGEPFCRWPPLWLALDDDGALDRVLPPGTSGLLPDGRPYEFRHADSTPGRLAFALPGSPTSEALAVELQPPLPGKPYEVRMDAHGDVWVRPVMSEPRSVQPSVHQAAIVVANNVVYRKYTRHGAIIGEWHLTNPAVPSLFGSAIDPAGNLWHLRFREDALEVIEYSGDPKVAQGRMVWELWSDVSPAGPLVALAEAAQATGATLDWDGAAGHAALRSAGRTFLFDLRAGLVRSPQGAPLAPVAMEIREGRVWAQADALRDICGLPVYATSGGRLVYAVIPAQPNQP